MRDVSVKDQEIIDYFNELHTKMIIQIRVESHKGINRMICIIREYGREFDKKYKDDPTVKSGGFVKVVKSVMMDLPINEAKKQALSHL